MAEVNGRHIIERLEKKWRLVVILSHLALAISAAIVLTALVHTTLQLSLLWSLPAVVIVFVLLLFTRQQWKVSEWDVSCFLNQQYPQLEESVHLFLKPYESLNFLQKLQVQKMAASLAELPVPKQFNRKLASSMYVLAAALVIGLLVLQLPVSFNNHFISTGSSKVSSESNAVSTPEKILPEIRLVNVQIIPPAYTGKTMRYQSAFNLLVEEGSEVRWQLKTNIATKKVSLVFNDKSVLALHSAAGEHTDWNGKSSFAKPGFYQVAVDNKLSEFYKIEIIKDLPPIIHIQAPGQHTVIDYGMSERSLLSVALSDDYGIADALVSATLSSGSGEAVKFKEQQLRFEDFLKGNRKYNLKKVLDLKSLGLQPGDELYFYVKAVDNHNQEKRSDVYIITLTDTARLMSMDGLVNGINVKPEYFRSERQIIIETEQLLKDRYTINQQEFNNRSNNLGIDQKLLRLRYGKFLGEENEAEIGGHEHDEGGHNDAADFGNAEKVIDEYSHKHDNAEDASFFEPELKAQLRTTLSEMWKAELQLRTNKPQDALPFEYKALRLLKDLQQKSRVYVAKTGFASTPLKPEKRLTGDLSKIIQPITRAEAEKKKDEYETSRRAAGILGLLKVGQSISAESSEILRQASLQLYNKAAAQPSLYLGAVASMNRIVAAVSKHRPASASDLTTTESGLRKLLSVPAKLPAVSRENSYEGLSQEYFKNLNKGNKQ